MLFGVSAKSYLRHLMLEDLKKQKGSSKMIYLLSSSWLGWCTLIILLGAVGKSCVEDHKKRKNGGSDIIPFWASLPGIFLSAILCVFCINAGTPYQLVIALAAVYCVYVFWAAKKTS